MINNNAEPSSMSDTELLAERKQVRESLLALSDRYEVLTAEFDRRAAAQWAQPSQSPQ